MTDKLTTLGRSYCWFFALSLVPGVCAYYLLLTLFSQNPLGLIVLSSFEGISFRGTAAIGILTVVTSCYALLAAAWATFVGFHHPRLWLLEATGVMVFALALSCNIGGLAWAFLDMTRGFFPADSRLWRHPLWAIEMAFTHCPQFMAASKDMMLVYAVIGYALIGIHTFKVRPRIAPPSHTKLLLEPKH